MRKNLNRFIVILIVLLSFTVSQLSVSAEPFQEDNPPEDNMELVGSSFNSPPEPPPEYEEERQASIQSLPSRGVLPDFPSYDWVFGCHAVAAAMIAAYYDRDSYTAMYTGPTNGGVMPISDEVWPTWTDSEPRTFPNNPLVASHNGVDDRLSRGTIDNYWVSKGSTADDPYITNGWAEHTWGSAIGDFMKTSQSGYFNIDKGTHYYYYSNGTKRTCAAMESEYHSSHGMYISDLDGTYGRKEFYEARGYTVNECYNQLADTVVSGGFSLTDFQAEIDARHPVLLRLYDDDSGWGHAVVGYGYINSTIYIRDTWDNDPENTYTMTWDGSYSGYELSGVGVVKLDHIADLYEPDDSNGVANWIFDGSLQTHSIVPVGDEDWVKFELASESGITLETSGPSGDTRMWLYDNGLSEVEYNDDSGSGNFDFIDRLCGDDPLPAGTYFVKIDEYADNDEIPAYDIGFNVIPCGDTFEPDDNSGEANWIFDGSPQTHSIVPVGDEDWVKFDLASDSGITLETSGPSGDTRIWLYNNGLSEVEYNDDGGSGVFSYIDRLCGIDQLPAGMYYVKIDEFLDDDEIPSYEISLNISTCGTTQHNIYLPLVMVD